MNVHLSKPFHKKSILQFYIRYQTLIINHQTLHFGATVKVTKLTCLSKVQVE